MGNKRHKGFIISGGALLVFSILLFAAGIVIGMLLSGFLNAAEPAPEDEPEDTRISDTLDTPKEANTSEPPPEPSPVPPEPDDEEDEPETSGEPGIADITAARASEYVASMSLREKICQMIIVTPDVITGVSGTTVAGSVTKAAIEKYPVGGLVHFASNITSGEQITQFNSKAQSYAKTPMFIASDEEGGRVGRLKTSIGAHSVKAMLTYEDDGADTAYGNAKTLADTLTKYGFNTDFAPVADVWSNPQNTVIGDRAYSSNFDTAAELVSAAVRGFTENGVICSLKHFPGHGDTREDSHNGAAYIGKTLSQLRESELKPFAAGISAGADMVMVGHLVVPEIDELPATLSHKLITGVLREELGFDGVVITDSLVMGAVTKYSAEYVAVTAVNAGIDILLMPNGVEKTISALTAAVESGEIPESRIDESAARIISLKIARGIIT